MYVVRACVQHMGYVLHEGEGAAPEGLQAGLQASNRMQDLILEEMRLGLTGNEVLASFTIRMEAEGIDGTMYSHPIGDHGHAAGPIIGLADMANKPTKHLGDAANGVLVRQPSCNPVSLLAASPRGSCTVFVYTCHITLHGCVQRAEMWYAVELCCRCDVPEWGGQKVLFRQEENGVVGKHGNHFAYRRQDTFHLVH